MLLLAMALAVTTPAPEQVLAGTSFEHLASRTDVICPARMVRSITPGDLDYAQEGFEKRLPPGASVRLEMANGAHRRCAGRNGLSCPVAATLEAMERVGLMESFADYICTHPNPR